MCSCVQLTYPVQHLTLQAPHYQVSLVTAGGYELPCGADPHPDDVSLVLGREGHCHTEVTQATIRLLTHLVNLCAVLNSFLNHKSLGVWAPLDKEAMVILHIAPQHLVLLLCKALGAPDQHRPVLQDVLVTHHLLYRQDTLTSPELARCFPLGLISMSTTLPLWPFRVLTSQG